MHGRDPNGRGHTARAQSRLLSAAGQSRKFHALGQPAKSAVRRFHKRQKTRNPPPLGEGRIACFDQGISGDFPPGGRSGNRRFRTGKNRSFEMLKNAEMGDARGILRPVGGRG